MTIEEDVWIEAICLTDGTSTGIVYCVLDGHAISGTRCRRGNTWTPTQRIHSRTQNHVYTKCISLGRIRFFLNKYIQFVSKCLPRKCENTSCRKRLFEPYIYIQYYLIIYVPVFKFLKREILRKQNCWKNNISLYIYCTTYNNKTTNFNLRLFKNKPHTIRM